MTQQVNAIKKIKSKKFDQPYLCAFRKEQNAEKNLQKSAFKY